MTERKTTWTDLDASARKYTELEKSDHAAFFAALDAVATPGEALIDAADRYKARVKSA